MEITIPKLKCKRCGAEWTPRKSDVRVCPKCHSAWWDIDKKERTKEKNIRNENKR